MQFWGVSQLVDCVIWDHDAAGSSPVTPISESERTMKIKDFKVGDNVYIFGNDVKEAKVTKIGKKYVYVIAKGSMWEEKFESPEYDMESICLVESKDYGTRRHLYKSLADIERQRKYNAMRKWIWGSYSSAQSHKYSYDQLKAVCDILNPNGEYDGEINI